MSLFSWHQTDWVQRWGWAGIWTAKGESRGCTCRGWGDQHHWAQAEKVIYPASPNPPWALQGEQLDLWRKARCSLLLAVQGPCSCRVWAAQWVLSTALMLPPLFYRGHKAICSEGAPLPPGWLLQGDTGARVRLGIPALQPHGAGLAVSLGLSSERCKSSNGSPYLCLDAPFVLTHLLAVMTSFTSHSYLMSSG